MINLLFDSLTKIELVCFNLTVNQMITYIDIWPSKMNQHNWLIRWIYLITVHDSQMILRQNKSLFTNEMVGRSQDFNIDFNVDRMVIVAT